MVKIGQLCVKIAGRDAGKECLVIKKLDNPYVMIDGATRRRKSNLNHLEIFSQVADIKEEASHEEVISALKGLGVKIKEKKRFLKEKSEKKKSLLKSEKKKASFKDKKLKSK